MAWGVSYYLDRNQVIDQIYAAYHFLHKLETVEHTAWFLTVARLYSKESATLH